MLKPFPPGPLPLFPAVVIPILRSIACLPEWNLASSASRAAFSEESLSFMEARTALVVALAGEEFEEPAWAEWRGGVGGRTEAHPEMRGANVKVVAGEGFASGVARLEGWEAEARGGRASASAPAALVL